MHCGLFVPLKAFSDFFCNAPTYRAAVEQAKETPDVYFFSMNYRSPREPKSPSFGKFFLFLHSNLTFAHRR